MGGYEIPVSAGTSSSVPDRESRAKVFGGMAAASEEK